MRVLVELGDEVDGILLFLGYQFPDVGGGGGVMEVRGELEGGGSCPVG